MNIYLIVVSDGKDLYEGKYFNYDMTIDAIKRIYIFQSDFLDFNYKYFACIDFNITRKLKINNFKGLKKNQIFGYNYIKSIRIKPKPKPKSLTHPHNPPNQSTHEFSLIIKCCQH